MARTEYVSSNFRITHTIEEEGPHPTIAYDYYDETYSITIVLEGEGVCFVEGKGHTLSPGTIVVVSPEEVRLFRLKQSGCHRRISLYFSGQLLSSLWDYELSLLQIFSGHAPGEENRYGPEQYNPQQVGSLLEQLCALLEQEESETKAPRAQLLILQLLVCLYESRRQVPVRMGSFVPNEITAKICNYIKDHLTEELTYQQLQSRFYVSRYQLSHVFQRDTGMTLNEYILYKRLIKAVSLIRGGQGLEAAAYKAGFCTYSHFYKVFRKRFGVSPKTYFFN